MQVMNSKRFVMTAAAGAVAAVAVMAAGGDPAPDKHEAVAQKLVSQCAGIHEGDAVLISGGVHDIKLLEDIAVNVRKQGAFPLLTVESDRMALRMMDDVPARLDSQAPTLGLKLAEVIDVSISVESSQTEGLFAHVPADRMAARAKAGKPVGDRMFSRGVRRVNLGNALYPTDALAKRFGITEEQLSSIFWAGVDVDYTKLSATGDAVKAALAAGKEIHLTNPNGTDLKLRVEGRPVFVSDGVISADEAQKGGAATETWLPAGEVFLAPVAGSGDGKVVIDRYNFQGKDVEGLTLVFKAGKITSMTAKSGMEKLKALYDASGPGRDELGVIDFGINRNVTLVAGSRMQAWMPAGMVTVVVGGNEWAGGANTSTFGINGFLPGSTVTLDGKPIVQAGSLKL